MKKSVVRARPGNLVGRKQNKQFNKDGPIAFLKLEYTEPSAGVSDKDLIKEHQSKANRPRRMFLSDTLGGKGLDSIFHSFPFNFYIPSSSQQIANNNNQSNQKVLHLFCSVQT